jgi:hypothetical protein
MPTRSPASRCGIRKAGCGDELVGSATAILDGLETVTEQLEPERAMSCRSAQTMAAVMIDEIRLRAHARPLDSDDL